ncbi:MAG: EexN family lipoprotein [Azoarcus sp.]|jgi:hypothetical protein|nr:EexN family lipoprotein [Azoarcus sp.]
MKSVASSIALLTLTAALTACEKEVRSVEWYKANDVERMSVIVECKSNPDKLNKTENCINAKKANREILNPGR